MIKVQISIFWILVTAILTGCTEPSDHTSDVLVTEVPHTNVKQQSIANCPFYARAAWMESLLLADGQESIDVSESYWMYWYWYEEILSNPRELQVRPQAYWQSTEHIIKNYGWMLEEEFAPDEAGHRLSKRQAEALAYLNREIPVVFANEERTHENVRALLDQAFGVNMEEVLPLARKAEDTIVKSNTNGSNVTLADVTYGAADHKWNLIEFPRVPLGGSRDWFDRDSNRIFRRVMRALNDEKPVIMSVYLDYNSKDDSDQTFKGSLIGQRPPEKQGSHMLVLSDYVVDDAPGFGRIGEGQSSQEEKEAALDGKLVLLKAKNSWGIDRPDRGITDGYLRFDRDYLLGRIPVRMHNGQPVTTVALIDFVLPPGY